MGRNKIVAVVVTYNRKVLLKECIESLINQSYDGFDIIIVDNSSSDGTYDYIEKYLGSRIKYINTGTNLGGAGGFEFGMEYATDFNYKYFWLMDDDSIPKINCLKKLLEAANKIKKFGFLSSKVLWKDGTLCKMNIQRAGLYEKSIVFKEEITEISMATFVSFFVSRDVIENVGLPIKEFFIWADDLEYSRRISRNYPCFAVNDSIVVHKCNSNNGGNIATDSVDRITRYQYAYRNEMYLYRREGFRGILHILVRTPIHMLRVILFSPNLKLKRINIIIKSTLKGVCFNPPIKMIKKIDKNRRSNF